MSFGLGDRTLDTGDRQPIRRDEQPRVIETQPVERIDREIEPRPPIVRDEPPRAIESPPTFPNPSLPIGNQWGAPVSSGSPQTEPGADIAPDDSVGGFYLGDFFIPFWLPLAAIGLWLFLKK